jgi:hypothetical protein
VGSLRIAALALALLVAGDARAAGPTPATIASGFYRGTVGKDTVSLCWDDESSEYYRENLGKTVQLEAVPGPTLVLMESEPSAPRSPDEFDATTDRHWRIAATGPDVRGTVREGDEPPMPIELRREAGVCAPGFEAHRLALAALPVKSGKERGVGYRTLRHPVTGVERLEIVSGLPAAAAEPVNRWIADRARELDAQWVDCREWDGAIAPRYLSSRWLVFEISTSGFCGGVHPNEEVTPFAFDGGTGQEIRFDEWVDRRYMDDGEARGELRALIRQKIVDEDDGDDHCAAHRDEIGDWHLAVVMTGAGFEFGLDETDRAYVACERTLVVPLDVMRRFIAARRRPDFDELAAAAQAAADGG